MGTNPWTYILIFIVVIAAASILISVLIGLAVGFAAKRYGAKTTNKFQKELRRMLPGENCGQCGCEDCDAYALAVLYGNASESACPYGDEQLTLDMIACVDRMHKLMEDPMPPKPKEQRIFGIWDKK